MVESHSFTLSSLAERLGVAQHRLIHLCEKGVVTPDLQDATGRGSSRVFSERNFLELAVALRLREMLLPVSGVRAIVAVLRVFEGRVERALAEFSLPGSLRGDDAPDLRIVLSDGQSIFFSLGREPGKAKLYGGIPLAGLMATEPQEIEIDHSPLAERRGARAERFGGPEASQFARLEVSVTEIARELRLD